MISLAPESPTTVRLEVDGSCANCHADLREKRDRLIVIHEEQVPDERVTAYMTAQMLVGFQGAHPALTKEEDDYTTFLATLPWKFTGVFRVEAYCDAQCVQEHLGTSAPEP